MTCLKRPTTGKYRIDRLCCPKCHARLSTMIGGFYLPWGCGRFFHSPLFMGRKPAFINGFTRSFFNQKGKKTEESTQFSLRICWISLIFIHRYLTACSIYWPLSTRLQAFIFFCIYSTYAWSTGFRGTRRSRPPGWRSETGLSFHFCGLKAQQGNHGFSEHP